MMSSIITGATILSLVFTLILVVPFAGYCFRFFLREFWRRRRERVVGDLVWYQIRPVSRDVESALEPKAQSNQLIQFLRQLQATKHGLFPKSNSPRRGVVTFAWHKESEGDRRLRLYMGITEAHDNFGTISGLARSLNCEVKECREGIPFEVDSSAISMAYVTSIGHSEVTDDIHSFGDFSVAFAESDFVFGTLFVTVEAIGNTSEKSRLGNIITENNSQAMGDGVGMQNVGGPAAKLSNQAVRTSIAAVAEAGDRGMSEEILKMAVSQLLTSSMTIEVSTPESLHRRQVGVLGLPFLAASVGIALVLPPAFVTVVAPMALLYLTTIFGTRAVVHPPLARRIERGEITVPSYYFWSLRWWISANRTYNKKVGGGDRRTHERSAPPSDHQVVYLYGVPLFQLLSFSKNAGASHDIDRQYVPNVGLSRSFGQDEHSYDPVIGVSGTMQPVYYRADEINVSRFIGGSAEIGKTNALQCEFVSLSYISKIAQDAIARGKDHFTVTPIWVEIKGKGAHDCYRLTASCDSVMIDCNNPNGEFRLALEGPRLNEMMREVESGLYAMSYDEMVARVVRNASSIVSHMKYGFPSGQIQGLAGPILSNIMQVAMLLTPEEIEELGIADRVNKDRPNIMEVASLLLGNVQNLNPGVVLIGTILPDLDTSDPREAALKSAAERLSKYIGQKGDRMDQNLQSSKMRINSLLQAREMWEPGCSPSDEGCHGRTDIYVGMIAEQEAPVIINTGPYLIEGEEDRYRNAEDATSIIHSGMTISSLWGYVKENFSGYGERDLMKRKYTVFYYDELSHLAERDRENMDVSDVFPEIVSEGRSSGCSIAGATQHFGRLSESSKSEVFSMRTKHWMRQPSGTDREQLKKLLPEGQTDFTIDSFLHLKTGQAVSEMIHNREITHPFTMYFPRVADWQQCLEACNGDNIAAINMYMDNYMSEDAF